MPFKLVLDDSSVILVLQLADRISIITEVFLFSAILLLLTDKIFFEPLA